MKKNRILITLLLIGIFLRFNNFGNYSLGFDQVQILENAGKIKSGDFTLIGPRTGPADMFTGPLIYYICALLMFLIPSPWAIVATSMIISFVTGIFLHILARKYLKPSNSVIYFLLWALSPFIVSLDRTTWNPNLTFLSSVLIFLPLFKIISQQKMDKTDIMFICLGSFLIYQAHFSGFLLIGIIILSYLFFIPKNIKSFILILGSGFSLFISLLPTIVFDYRNNFINLKGMQYFLFQKIGEDQNYSFINKFIKSFLITLENFGKTLFLYNSYQLVIFIGLLIILIYYFINKQKAKTNLFLILYLVFPVFVFIFYRGSLPEYYFIIQFPAIIYISSILISKLKNINYLILIFCFYSLFINISINSQKNPQGIKNLLTITQKIDEIDNDIGINNLMLDIKQENRFGIDYLLKNKNYINPNGQIIHLAYPISDIKKYDYVLNNWGIWIDPRIENYNYIEKNSFIIQTSPSITIYQNYYLNQSLDTQESYNIQYNNEKIGTLAIYSRLKNSQKFEYYYNEISDLTTKDYIKNKNITKFQNQYIISYYKQNNFIAVIIPEKEFNQTDFINNINFLNISDEI